MFSAFIPIKQHSSRVSNKNVREFNGKPLFEWIIEKLVYDIKEINNLVIDADSEELIDILSKYRPNH